MNALPLLCEIITHGGKVSSGFFGEDDFVHSLLQQGYLREDGLVSSIVCQEAT